MLEVWFIVPNTWDKVTEIIWKQFLWLNELIYVKINNSGYIYLDPKTLNKSNLSRKDIMLYSNINKLREKLNHPPREQWNLDLNKVISYN